MLTIGEVAARTGLRPSAIRFYESAGLLPRALRQGGKRVYDTTILQRVAVIQLAKAAGLELAEIRALLTASGTPRQIWRAMVKGKAAAIDREIQTLARMKQVLAGLAKCSCLTTDECGRAFSKVLTKYAAQTEQRRRMQKPTRRATFVRRTS